MNASKAASANTLLPTGAPISFDWVTIPSGEFFMGSDREIDPETQPCETPQHKFYLAEYRITRTPVTVAQFACFVHATGYQTAAERDGCSWVWHAPTFDLVEGADWRHPCGPDDSVVEKQNHPVVAVSWYDAQMFCRWAGAQLPTEAEWEKAARGPDGRIWPWGNSTPNARLCNFNMHVGGTSPVDDHMEGKSPYGMLDMVGNVWQWTSSLWGTKEETPDYGYPYDPNDGRENPNEPATVMRVLRGGSWCEGSGRVRCALRGMCDPSHPADVGGFRVVFRSI